MGKVFSPGDETASESRKKILKANKIPLGKVIAAELVHGNKVRVVSDLEKKVYQSCDGLITSLSDVLLTVTMADCAAVFFFDPEEKNIGICHAGRKGVEAGVVKEIVRAMTGLYSESGNILCAISPAINPCCYEMDLKAAILSQLLKSGIGNDNIYVHPDCTCCSANYFSYRKGDDIQGGEVQLAGIILKQ